MTTPMPPEVRAIFARPIPDKFIKTKPDTSKADYVAHPVIRQYLLALTDAHEEIVIRETAMPMTGVRKGGRNKGKEYSYTQVAMLVQCRVCVDGVWYGPWQEWGESENEKNPWKSAQSDAIKRLCAMHLGLGLKLWAREQYFLPQALAQNLAAGEEAAAEDGAVDDGLAHDEEEADEAPPAEVPSHTPPPVEHADPAVEPTGLTVAANRKFHALLREMGCDEPTYRGAMWAIYKVESISEFPRSKAKALLTALDKNEEDRRAKFIDAGTAKDGA